MSTLMVAMKARSKRLALLRKVQQLELEEEAVMRSLRLPIVDTTPFASFNLLPSQKAQITSKCVACDQAFDDGTDDPAHVLPFMWRDTCWYCKAPPVGFMCPLCVAKGCLNTYDWACTSCTAVAPMCFDLFGSPHGPCRCKECVERK